MSKAIKQKTLHTLKKMKKSGQPISMITCYDSAFARIIAQSNIDAILIGDSMGNVVMGMDHTLQVTVDDIVHHCKSVTRVQTGCFVIADLPFGSYATVEKAIDSSVRMIKEGGAAAIKLEGGEEVCEQIRAIAQIGIPVVGHLGFTPQSLHKFGGYRVQGRGDQSSALISNAKAIEKAGAEMIVLEMVPSEVAKEVVKSVNVPVIGIGAGSEIDGQVLVLHDMLGFDMSFQPTFLKRYMQLESQIKGALDQYCQEVKSKVFPAEEHGYQNENKS